jgi:hypothetical protein
VILARVPGPPRRAAGLDFMVDVNAKNKTVVETPGISTYKTEG